MSEGRNTIMEEPVEAGEYERTGEEIEDYTLEGDSFTFYYDITAVK